MTAGNELPDYAVLGEDLVTTLVARPRWLYVWQTTDQEGASWLSVYRSVAVADDDSWLHPFQDQMSDGPVRSEVVRDVGIHRRRAELSVYAN